MHGWEGIYSDKRKCQLFVILHSTSKLVRVHRSFTITENVHKSTNFKTGISHLTYALSFSCKREHEEVHTYTRIRSF